MDPESKQLLERTFELSLDNNKMLHKLRSVQKREFIWRAVKFILIIGIAFGAFYYIEPYMNKVMDIYNSVTGIQESAKNVSDSASSLQDLLKKLP